MTPDDCSTHGAAVAGRHRPAAGALVLGGAHGSLAVTRSLGRRGIPVWVLTHDHPIAGLSRYAQRRFAWPGPGNAGAVEHLMAFIEQHRLQGWMLIASGDAELRLVSQHHDQLSRLVRVTAPPWHIGALACDKGKTYRAAQAAGLDVPRCYQIRDRSELQLLECQFPVVIKPASQSTVNALTSAKAWKINDRDELIARYDEAVALVGDAGIVLQEFIPGTGDNQYSYAAVWQDGKPVASLVARRQRQYPVEFGFTSTCVETIDCEPIETPAVTFLKAINYSGIVELEFKYDSRDGRYKLLDFNARAWTWVALGAASGVDFPYALWLAQNGDPVVPGRGRTGAKWMHVARDLTSALVLMKRGVLAPRDYLRSWQGPRTFAAFAIDDPLPGLLELPITAYRVMRRRNGIGPALSARLKSMMALLGQYWRSDTVLAPARLAAQARDGSSTDRR
ncbi:MAG: ATP-grasp domain-containing protein [Hyphomicrobiales bacterium]